MMLSALELGAQAAGVEASGTRRWGAKGCETALLLILLQVPSAVVEEGLRMSQ